LSYSYGIIAARRVPFDGVGQLIVVFETCAAIVVEGLFHLLDFGAGLQASVRSINGASG
jgi:hypothetical protein